MRKKIALIMKMTTELTGRTHATVQIKMSVLKTVKKPMYIAKLTLPKATRTNVFSSPSVGINQTEFAIAAQKTTSISTAKS